jgi:hypothetical protein
MLYNVEEAARVGKKCGVKSWHVLRYYGILQERLRKITLNLSQGC